MSGVISSIYGSANVRTIPAQDWASCAVLYQTYRVHRIRLTLIPLQTYTSVNSGGFVVIAKWHNDGYNLIGTSVQCLDATESKIMNVLATEPETFTVSDVGINKPWQKVDVAQNAEDTFGLKVVTGVSLSASVTYFQVIESWDVEFNAGC